MLSTDELRDGVSIATLGSVSILTASFLQKVDFISDYKGNFPLPFTVYMIAGLFFLLSSGAYLLFSHSEEQQASIPTLLNQIFQLSLIAGLLSFFGAAVITLKIYFFP